MKQQLIISGIGGQGVLFLTRVIAQVAVNRSLSVLTAETHGMAQRGGTVLSTLKVGAFASPLIRLGQADVGLLLWDANLPVHRPYMNENGFLLINAPTTAGDGLRIDASGMARQLGNAVLSNLVMLGFAVRQQRIFCTQSECEAAIRQLAPSQVLDQNLAAFGMGLAYDGLNPRNENRATTSPD